MNCNLVQPIIAGADLDIVIGDFVNLASGNATDMRNTGTYTFEPVLENNQAALLAMIKLTGIADNVSDELAWFSRTALTNGVVLQRQRRGAGSPTVIATYKNNFELLFYSNQGDDGAIQPQGNAGQYSISAHMHWEPLKNRLRRGDKYEIIIQDDLSTMGLFRACAFYQVVTL